MKMKTVCTVLAAALLLIPVSIVAVSGFEDRSSPGLYLNRYNEKHYGCNMSESFEITEDMQLTRAYNVGGMFSGASAYAKLTVTPAFDASVAVEIRDADGKYQVVSCDTDYYPNGTDVLITPIARVNTRTASYLWYFGEQWIGNERLYLWDLHYYAYYADHSTTNAFPIGDTTFRYAAYCAY